MRTFKMVAAMALAIGGLAVGGAEASASAAPIPSCKPAQMTVSVGRSNGTAGTMYHTLIFTNTGGTCVIWGVPAIQPVAGASHKPVGPRASNSSKGEMPAHHTLTKGQSVSVAYGVGDTANYTVGCAPKNADGVLVSLSPFVRSTYVKMAISVCTARVSTHSQLIVPGRTGI
jgi:hypothetical protein